MGVFDRGIRGNVQSPFSNSNTATSTAYSNPRMPIANQGNVQFALDYLLAGMYPDYKGTAATPSALPTTGNNLNDLWLVQNDGDGKSAGYVWSSIQGTTKWVKRYDPDWSYDQILSDTVNRTSYMYAAKYGVTDKDALGNPITGQFAGQRIYGGDQTGQNLTLTANVTDLTGQIQTTNTIVPTSANAVDLGTAAAAFRNAYLATGLVVGTTTLSAASLTDSGGAFSFGSNNLSTTGAFSAKSAAIGTMSIGSGSLNDSSGAISFGSDNLATTGTVTAASGSKLADITFTAGTLATASTVFSFSNQNIQGVGTLTSSKIVTGEVDVANLVLSGQTLNTNAAATNLILQAGTSGSNANIVQVNSKCLFKYDAEVTGTLIADGSATIATALTVASVIKLEAVSGVAQVESVTGDLRLVPSANVSVFGVLAPSADATRDLGTTGLRWRNIYLSGGVSDGTNTTSIATLTSLRNITNGATSGMSIFWDGAKWFAASPNVEVDHTQILNLTAGDAGHTQFALLAGRSGGQSLKGGTASGDNLTLDSTANATKGLVVVNSTFAPGTTSALDLGTTSAQFRNMYSTGLHYGLRFDQYAGSGNYPTNSGSTIGRVIWDTTLNQLLVDNGTTWSKVGQQKWVSDTSWNGSITTLTVTVSSLISDATQALWQLCDNANNFNRMHVNIATSQTQVTITVNQPLPSGSYRLIGLN